jgi:SPP1 gp7 family putative phage head morphogenesis protein
VIPASTVALVEGQRQAVNLTVDRAVRSVVDEYVRVADRVSRQLTRLLLDEAATLQAGQRLSLNMLRERERAERLLLTVQNQLATLAEQGQLVARSTVTGELVPLAVDYENAMIRSQLPAELRTFGTSVSPEALQAVIVRADDRVRYLRRMSEETARVVNRTLTDGIVAGDNPRAAARTLMRRLNGALEGGRVRAERIMRTEMLDAYRNANAVIQNANRDVVEGWEWWASADDRTCSACWAMHGERFPNDVPGPDGHPNCRCARVPVVLPSLAGDFPMGPSKDELWGRLTEDQKRNVLGPTRYELTGGGPPPPSFATQVPAGEWRSYRIATPVRDLVAVD